MRQIREVLPQQTHEFMDGGIHYRQKPSKNSKNDFHLSELKNPDPSKAFSFVMMIAIGAVLLPFLPVAANYLSHLMDNEPLKNNRPAYLVNQPYR